MYVCPDGEIGIRTALKMLRSWDHAGSSPALGTNLLNSFNGRTSAFQADDDGSIPLFSSIMKYSFGSQVVRQWSATPRPWVQISSKTPICRCSLMVEHYLAKVTVGVRFSSLAPFGTLAQRQSKRLLTVRLQVRILHVPPLNAYLAQLAAQLTCNQ